MIHTTNINKYNGTMQELVTEIGDLRYDALDEFLRLLSEKIKTDGDKDHSRGREKLSKCLYESASLLQNASIQIKEAWVICEPYTK